MCLAVPGKILAITDTDPLTRSGAVSFNGVVRQINLSCVPDAVPGDYVVVHVGLAIAKLDVGAAERALVLLQELGGAQPSVDSGDALH